MSQQSATSPAVFERVHYVRAVSGDVPAVSGDVPAV
jgi:hypothetical protein